MLKKFSLYGFLKNQQYYEYFLLLAFRQMGLSYFVIGLLIAFREIMINLMEVPSGAIADLSGRRRAMIFSFSAYIVSFGIFGLSGTASLKGGLHQNSLILLLMLAMFFFAIGEAFRSGTHKSIIFMWLEIHGLRNERTRVYGYTRSWSKIGSAVSVLLACIFVFATSNFIDVFFFAIIPYVLNIINLASYPRELDGKVVDKLSIKQMFKHLKDTLVISFKRPTLKRLILESMGFEGFFKASKDYLQPILKSAAFPITAFLFSGMELTDEQKSVFLIGPVFFVLFLLSAAASRNAYRLVEKKGEEENAARFLWGITVLVSLMLLPAMFFGFYVGMIVGFVALYILQNIWRPVLISRFNASTDNFQGATVLSLESQAKSVSTMLIAPFLGLAIDLARQHGIGVSEFWPVGILGLGIGLGFFLTAKRR